METNKSTFNRQSSEYGSTEYTGQTTLQENTAPATQENGGKSPMKQNSILPESRKVMSKFSISEPQYQNLNGKGKTSGRNSHSQNSITSGCCKSCCFDDGGGGWHEDGLRMIILSMFVFAIAITVALVIDIASTSPQPVTENHANKVISDIEECSNIGTEVMNQGGNAVDAAVASGFCLSVYEPHITSIGGGGMMLLHRHRTNKSVVIDFRETVPENANEDPSSRSQGRWSVGVPGFVKGLWTAHKKYGSGHDSMECCTWALLIQKTIHKVVRHGVRVTSNLATATKTKIGNLMEDNGTDTHVLRKFIKDYSSFRGAPESNSNLHNLKTFRNLINTLKMIASNGPSAFYENRESGSIVQDIVSATGGAITANDLKAYEPIERDPIVTHIGHFEVMASSAPSSGPELLAYLNTMETWYTKQLEARHAARKGEISNNLSSKEIQIRQHIGLSTQEYWSTMINLLTKLNHYQLGLGDPTNNTARVNDRTNWMISKSNTEQFLSSIRKHIPFESNYKISSGESVAGQVMAMDKEDNYVSMVTSLNTW